MELEKNARIYAGIPEDSPQDLKYCVMDKKAKYDAFIAGANWQKEQKPVEWINELEEKLSNATPEQLAEWKEKYFKEEPAAWNEEDERLFQIIIDTLDKEEHKGHLSHTDLIACVRKLKDLKERYTWKPSKEQMKVLWETYKGGEEQAALTSLYSDLKKLREE